MTIYHPTNEFIFKSNLDLSSDLSTLISRAEDYLHSLKSPSDFWDKKDQMDQQEKINEVTKYINGLHTIMNFAIDSRLT